jgi:hypothetical protein
VEVPPHYDTFAEFTYSYHYGDAYIPYIKQDEPLKLECQHFVDCIRQGTTPITDGRLGLEVVRILEAASNSLREQGSAVETILPDRLIKIPATNGNGNGDAKEHANGNGNGNAMATDTQTEMVTASWCLRAAGQWCPREQFPRTISTNCAGREAWPTRQDLRVHESVWLPNRRRRKNWHFCRNSKKRARGQSLQNLKPQFPL